MYQGYVSHPAEKVQSGGARGALVAHQWKGLGDYEKSRADEMAAMGYVAFALDVYGKGVRCNTTACAQAAMQAAMSNVSRLQRLISAGTQQLTRWADATQLVAIGYCFGGSVVLELARHPQRNASAGVAYRAVASVHGVLAPLGAAAATGEVRARVQVHHADLDFQGDGALASLEAELRRGVNGTDGLWETAKYRSHHRGSLPVPSTSASISSPPPWLHSLAGTPSASTAGPSPARPSTARAPPSRRTSRPSSSSRWRWERRTRPRTRTRRCRSAATDIPITTTPHARPRRAVRGGAAAVMAAVQ